MRERPRGTAKGRRVARRRQKEGSGCSRGSARANANIKSNISRAVRGAAPLESGSRSPWFYLFLI